MLYCRIKTKSGSTYAEVVERNGQLWVERTLSVAPWLGLELTTKISSTEMDPIPLGLATLLPPVEPGKIICVGRNYRDHAAEMGNDIPTEPLLFFKPISSLLAPGAAIEIPTISERVDYEGELAVVIGKRLRNLKAEEDARDYIHGYTIVNDISARDLQKKDGQWTRAKGFDTFCPVGPVVSTALDPTTTPVTVETRLNGDLRQRGSSADLIFPIPELLRYISAFMTLEPGDLLSTGTPAGVGPIQPGDHVEVTIPGIGTLSNPVV
jgi:2-keto-4-pentenoate hydratase/2-oxohepta-3-ene-1,7-dioic acid hydratase in catechol pathway